MTFNASFTSIRHLPNQKTKCIIASELSSYWNHHGVITYLLAAGFIVQIATIDICRNRVDVEFYASLVMSLRLHMLREITFRLEAKKHERILINLSDNFLFGLIGEHNSYLHCDERRGNFGV